MKKLLTLILTLAAVFARCACGDIYTAKYCGGALANAGDEVLLACGPKAYNEVRDGRSGASTVPLIFPCP